MYTMHLDSPEYGQRSAAMSSCHSRKGGTTMFFFILKKNVASDNKDLIAREMQRHLEAWRPLSNATWSEVLWIGDELVLATDSPELMENWWPTECEYVEYMLGDDSSTDEKTFDVVDLDETDDVSDDWPFPPAA